ncbi:hypothetical protein SANTM175S_10774 [Streptomyces antimycoticus]
MPLGADDRLPAGYDRLDVGGVTAGARVVRTAAARVLGRLVGGRSGRGDGGRLVLSLGLVTAVAVVLAQDQRTGDGGARDDRDRRDDGDGRRALLVVARRLRCAGRAGRSAPLLAGRLRRALRRAVAGLLRLAVTRLLAIPRLLRLAGLSRLLLGRLLIGIRLLVSRLLIRVGLVVSRLLVPRLLIGVLTLRVVLLAPGRLLSWPHGE